MNLENHLDAHVTDCLPPKGQERLYLTLVRSHSRFVVLRSDARLYSGDALLD